MIHKPLLPLTAIPRVREAPSCLLRGLREIDQQADLLYMGPRRWLLCTVKPDNNRERYHAGQQIVAHWARVNPKPGTQEQMERNSLERFHRVQFGQLAMMGVRPIQEYAVSVPDSAIVEDFRLADFKFRHYSDQDLEEEIESPREKARAAALKDLTDTERAYAAWRYAFTRSHYLGYKTDHQLAREEGSTRAGYKREMTI